MNWNLKKELIHQILRALDEDYNLGLTTDDVCLDQATETVRRAIRRYQAS